MPKSHQLWTEITLAISTNAINSIIRYILFITLVRLLFKDKLMPAALTTNLTSLMITIEVLHLAVKLIIFCLLPQVLSSMFINSMIHIWIITIIQSMYISAEIEQTPRHLLEGIQQAVIWISANKLEPHLQYAAEICKTVKESIAFRNEAGIFDWIQAFFRYRKITQAGDSV